MQDSLADALARLGVSPLPSPAQLAVMNEEQRRAAVAAACVPAERFDELPQWYRDHLQRKVDAGRAGRVPGGLRA